MLEIFNELEPFFQDNYRRINIREYARLSKISPPSASKRLAAFRKEGLLKNENDRKYIYYYANRESQLFVGLSRLYWQVEFEKCGLISHIEKELVEPVVVLFGSFSKAEIKHDSDIDIAVFSVSRKDINLGRFEGRLGRKVQLFAYGDRNDVKSRELLNNIMNGFIIRGSW